LTPQNFSNTLLKTANIPADILVRLRSNLCLWGEQSRFQLARDAPRSMLQGADARWKSGNPRTRKNRYPTVKKRAAKPRKEPSIAV